MGSGSIKGERADYAPCVLQGRETAPPGLRKVKEKVEYSLCFLNLRKTYKCKGKLGI